MSAAGKLVSLSDLAALTAGARAAGCRVVHCHGVFDLLHVGHIRYLERARALGDMLVVTVTRDAFVNKGPHRPAFPEQVRAEVVASLACVDHVAINEGPTASETIARLAPHVYAKGAEFRDHRTPEILLEEAAAAAVGCEMAFIEDITSSSSHLLNRYLSPFGPEVDAYLADFAARHPVAEVLGRLDAARALRPVVVGEMIIDEYHYCSTLGQSSRAPLVAMQYLSHERFAGGAAGVANHLAGFCEAVDVFLQVGDLDTEEEWVRAQLKPNVRPTFVRKADSPTVTKLRYRESYFAQPMFEIYRMNDAPPEAAAEAALCEALAAALPGHDMVVVADYGHGMLTPAAIALLTAADGFLVVNTQSNAGNAGYHTIGKYARADYATLAENELRLECRVRGGEPHALAQSVARRLGTRALAVTRGGRGCLCVGGDELHEAPALAAKVVDRVGAGDAFLALSALGAAQGAPLEVLAFLGNVAGAEAAATVGNRETLEATRLERHVRSLLR